MRPGQYKGEIRPVHGPSWLARGSDTESHLDQIVDFITTHPMEFVVLTMESTSAAQLTHPLKEKLCQMLLAKFKHYMVTLQDELCLATVTMGQLWELDKRIVVIVESALLPDIPDAKNVYDKQGLYNWSVV
ncbi:hypothetical protein SARC_12343 [Sphaeroforma arctica JP610]|uniref:Uncharacterized protein n=1 Tax=Sphaeroforma arctica JP610 TaxID=667725 RepID=A0A0L0FGH0_9EUKA|nr:hypothetical protein SARC_12343 [Sphaeroforma arctica JP610]KNC75123.1 hypothetical protein SARC_12343 [Sphaeroforma arctica JP610]|eukprot:XP_014149025.1 hypothetical protein SARC_12343 [Sphaeroforma arctica JP610]